MATKLVTWDSEKTREEIRKRLKNAQQSRSPLEDRWIRNESTLYDISSSSASNYGVGENLNNSLENIFNVGNGNPSGSDANSNAAYTFKNLRFIHAQMSANPPAVAMRPQSSDQEDRRKADAADRIVRWALRKYILQEKIDQFTLHTLVYGSGFIKAVWDSTKGDVIDFNEEDNSIETEGDISITVPFVWNIFLDPDAKTWDEVKWVIERIYVDFEEACMRWPDKIDILKKARVTEQESLGEINKSSRAGRDTKYNVVELYEYWETGLPTNGQMGRYCITDREGQEVEPTRPSPHRFKKAGALARLNQMDIPDEVKEARLKRLPEQAALPYHFLSDIDVPNMVWGKSFVEYTNTLQDNLNRLDTAVLDAIQAHGVARMVLTESAEIADDSLANSNWDVMRITGNTPPYFVNPPALMGEIPRFRQDTLTGINDLSGVNESMFGQQSREQSGASMQYATNQGNMIRRRLFNKYVLSVESLYKTILNLVRKHWTMGRTISVLGKEKALEAVDIKGADIDGGYDVIGEYGVTLSLDPITRREEIMTLQPLFEKAGVPVRKSLELLKLNELEGMYDSLDKAGSRQKEIFDAMIGNGVYLPPEDLMDHENMIAWALDYFMSQEFTALPEETRALLKQHVRDRIQLAASEQSAQGPAAPGPEAAPQGLPPLPPM